MQHHGVGRRGTCSAGRCVCVVRTAVCAVPGGCAGRRSCCGPGRRLRRGCSKSRRGTSRDRPARVSHAAAAVECSCDCERVTTASGLAVRSRRRGSTLIVIHSGHARRRFHAQRKRRPKHRSNETQRVSQVAHRAAASSTGPKAVLDTYSNFGLPRASRHTYFLSASGSTSQRRRPCRGDRAPRSAYCRGEQRSALPRH